MAMRETVVNVHNTELEMILRLLFKNLHLFGSFLFVQKAISLWCLMSQHSEVIRSPCRILLQEFKLLLNQLIQFHLFFFNFCLSCHHFYICNTSDLLIWFTNFLVLLLISTQMFR